MAEDSDSPQFEDREGRTWSLRITVKDARRVQDETGINVLTMDGLQRVVDNPLELYEVLWVLCEDQADRAGVSPEEFGEAIDGEALSGATDALVEALENFIPPQKRRMMRALRGRAQEIDAEQTEEMVEAIENGEMDGMLREMFGSASFGSPGSPE